VESVGPGGDHLRIGAPVCTTGTLTGAYAELALCRTAQVHAPPEQVSYHRGLESMFRMPTSYRSLFQLAVAKLGETVLIHGARGGDLHERQRISSVGVTNNPLPSSSTPSDTYLFPYRTLLANPSTCPLPVRVGRSSLDAEAGTTR
jgi:hypothetical protein